MGQRWRGEHRRHRRDRARGGDRRIRWRNCGTVRQRGRPTTRRPSSEPVPASLKIGVLEARRAGLRQSRGRGTLKWAIGVSPPFGFKLSNGKWAGVEAQNAAEMARSSGSSSTITDYSYDILPTTLAANKADIIGAQLFVTADRKKVIDFSVPYYLSGQIFYVLKSSPTRRSPISTSSNVHSSTARAARRGPRQEVHPEGEVGTAPLQGQLHPVQLPRLEAGGRVDGRGGADEGARRPYKDIVGIGLHGRITTPRAAAEATC